MTVNHKDAGSSPAPGAKCEDCGEVHMVWWDCEENRRAPGIDTKAAGSWRKGLSSESD